MDPTADPIVVVTRQYISQILTLTGWTLSDLARRSKIAHSTLTRFMNGPNVTWALSSRSLAKIRKAATEEISPAQLDALWSLAQRADPP